MSVDPAARELSITYGDVEIGGESPTNLLDGVIRFERDGERASVEFDVVLAVDSSADLQAAAESFELAMSKPWQDLTITQDSLQLVSASQSSNTALNASAKVTKVGADTDSGRSRDYLVRIEYEVPADWNQTSSGLRRSTVAINYSASRRRTVRISGEYTAIEGSDARAQYESVGDAFCDAALTALTGTFELIEEDIASETNDKVATFSRVYQEIIFAQAGSSDDPGIVSQSLQIARAPADEGNWPDLSVSTLTPVTARFEAWIDKDVTTDLQAKWLAIRSSVLGTVRSYESGSTALVRETPEFDPDENRISVSLEFLGSGGTVISASVSVEESDDFGNVVVPAWTDDQVSAYVYDGPRTIVRTVTQSIRLKGKQSIKDQYQPLLSRARSLVNPRPEGAASKGGRWLRLQHRPVASALDIGIDTPITVTDVQCTTAFQWVRILGPITPSSGSSGSSGAEAPPDTGSDSSSGSESEPPPNTSEGA